MRWIWPGARRSDESSAGSAEWAMPLVGCRPAKCGQDRFDGPGHHRLSRPTPAGATKHDLTGLADGTFWLRAQAGPFHYMAESNMAPSVRSCMTQPMASWCRSPQTCVRHTPAGRKPGAPARHGPGQPGAGSPRPRLPGQPPTHFRADGRSATPRPAHAFAFLVDAAAIRLFESARFVLGPEVASFKAEFACYCQARHAIGVSSGTGALHLALFAAGVGSGDEVITVRFTHSWLPWLRFSARAPGPCWSTLSR